MAFSIRHISWVKPSIIWKQDLSCMLLLSVTFCRVQPLFYINQTSHSCPEKLQVLLSTVWILSTSPGGPWKWKRFGSSGCFPRNTSGISSSLSSLRLQILSFFNCSVLEHLYSHCFLLPTCCYKVSIACCVGVGSFCLYPLFNIAF